MGGTPAKGCPHNIRIIPISVQQIFLERTRQLAVESDLFIHIFLLDPNGKNGYKEMY
jgi:hypothetical protein